MPYQGLLHSRDVSTLHQRVCTGIRLGKSAVRKSLSLAGPRLGNIHGRPLLPSFQSMMGRR